MSWSRLCPVFIQKCKEMNGRLTENNMPYFPTDEPWTHILQPPKSTYRPPPWWHTTRTTHRALLEALIDSPPCSSRKSSDGPTKTPYPRTPLQTCRVKVAPCHLQETVGVAQSNWGHGETQIHWMDTKVCPPSNSLNVLHPSTAANETEDLATKS